MGAARLTFSNPNQKDQIMEHNWIRKWVGIVVVSAASLAATGCGSIGAFDSDMALTKDICEQMRLKTDWYAKDCPQAEAGCDAVDAEVCWRTNTNGADFFYTAANEEACLNGSAMFPDQTQRVDGYPACKPAN
jgi:hypothetical protein